VKRKHVVFLLSLLIVPSFFTHSLAFGLVDWNIQKTLKLDTQPLDVAVSKNGSTIFVLTKSDKILIYTPDGRLKDQIDIGHHVDQIKPGPTEEWLYLSNFKKKTIEVLHVDYIQHIDISGSPYKGSENAPIAIVVFSDFQ
jgi:hypothetical protein